MPEKPQPQPGPPGDSWYRAAFHATPDALVLLNDAGVYVEANEAACRLFGLSRGQLIGSRYGSHSPGGLTPEEAWAGIAKQGQWMFETELLRPDGEVRIVEVGVAGGILPGFHFAGIRDVTDRRNADLALRAVRTRYRDLLECISDALVVTDSNRRITDVNPACEAMFGYSREQFIGQLTTLLYESEAEYLDLGGFYGSLGRRHSSIRRARFKRRDGSTFLGEISGRAFLDAGGRSMGRVGLIRDVGERAHLEEQLRQAQKLEAVGGLAGGVAHDFNNLLSVIVGYGGMALAGMDAADPNHARILEMMAAAERASALTKQLLTFSRKSLSEPRSLELRVLLVNMEDMLRRLIGEDVELLTSLAPDLGRIHSDPGQVEQVVMNLAINARDAMPQGGVLLIEARNITVEAPLDTWNDTLNPGEYVQLSVTDTGMGMDEATREKIFEPFFTTKGPGEGTGLGLSTVYGIVKQSGGGIFVFSEVDYGTTFKIFLPRETSLEAEVPAASPMHAAPAKETEGSETVLLVEDDPVVRRLQREILGTAGYHLIVAAGPAECIAMLPTLRVTPQLLVTDVIMPGMNGREMAEHVTRQFPGLKVLFVSGYSGEAIGRRGVLEPGVQLLQKPFTPQQFRSRVREILDAGPGVAPRPASA